MTHPPPRSYLLRLWRDHAAAPLRATLTAVSRPDEQRHFADLEALFAFLRTEECEVEVTSNEQRTT